MKRRDLVKTLELVQPALADTNLVQVYTCFMFKQKSVSAYNDEIGIVSKWTLPIPEPFASGGTIILGLLQNSHAEDVDIEITDECVLMKAGKSTFRLPYMKQDEFLFTEPKEKWAISATITDQLLMGIEICLTTSSTDQAQPAYLGVCFHANGNTLTLFSTDGDAITRYKTKTKFGGKGTYTVSNPFCNALIKICRETDTRQGSLEISNGWALATLNNGYKVYGRMIVNDKPLDYQGVIDATLTGKQPFVDKPLGLNDALARARVVADPESAKTVMTVENGKLRLVTDTHLGVVRDELRVKGHANAEAAVHASLVQRSLAFCDQLSIRDNCTAYRLEDVVLQVLANIGT